MESPISLTSRCVRDPQVTSLNPPHQVPIVAASSFVFESIEQGMRIFDGEEAGHIYSRFGNPTIDAAGQKIADLEAFATGADAVGLLTSSGMGAISTLLLALLRPGDAILTQADLYGGTAALMRDILGPLGIEYRTADLRDLQGVERELQSNAHIRLLYFETPANPTLRCVDIAALSALARRHSAYSVVDNTFCTPIVQRPLAQGVDFVVHSTTKYLNGHGTGVAGAIVARDGELMQQKIVPALRLTGPSANPWDAWLVLNGLKTLALRMERHSSNAQRVAEWLGQQEGVAAVNFPGMPQHPDRAIIDQQMHLSGGMLSFELEGGLESGKRFMNALRFCTLTPTLGDVDTLVLHPASMSHRALPREVRLAHGIPDGLIRLSVGVESVEDIINDLQQALTQA